MDRTSQRLRAVCAATARLLSIDYVLIVWVYARFILDPETGLQAPPTLFLVLVLVLLSDFRYAKAF